MTTTPTEDWAWAKALSLCLDGPRGDYEAVAQALREERARADKAWKKILELS